MKILIVEDDNYKADAIKECLQDNFRDTLIDVAESLASGLFYLMDGNDYQLIVLDMSMPSFDISEKDPTGGAPESYAGEDFLSHMTLLGLVTPVVVVTQYDNFGSDDQQVSLTKLSKKLRLEHPEIYVGSVYFKVSSTAWKVELLKLLESRI